MATVVEPEPIFIGGQAVFCKFFAMPRDPGEPPRIEGLLSLIGGEGVLTLDALVGPQGIPGEPSPIIRPQWASGITDPQDLPDVATLDDADDGRAWYIDGQWHVFSNAEYHVIQGSIPGPPGVTPNIGVTAELVDAGDPPVFGPIVVTESGPSTAPNFHIEIPGVPGPEGPPGSIVGVEAQAGYFIRRNEDNTAWEAVPPSSLTPKIYTIPQSSFTEHTGSDVRFMVAAENIPAQSFDWYPDVTGHLWLQRSSFLSSVQYEVEVRIGNTGIGTGEGEQLCGLGPYDPSNALLDAATYVNVLPHWSDGGNPSFALSPDTQAGRVPAGQAKTIYVFIHRIAGSGSYVFTRNGAQLRIMVVPVG